MALSHTDRRPLLVNAGSTHQPPVHHGCGADDTPTCFITQIYRQIAKKDSLRLQSLDRAASDAGLGRVYVTQPTTLSARALGITWAVFRAVTNHLGLTTESQLLDVKKTISTRALTLIAAVDEAYILGVASAAHLLTIPLKLYVSGSVASPAVLARLHSQGIEVVACYDTAEEAVATAKVTAASTNEAIFQDFLSFSMLDMTPRWIVEGFSPLLEEVVEQLQGANIDLVIVPVGAGLLAQAAVSYFRNRGHRSTRFLCVEPDTAACLWKSLEADASVTTPTTPTIMSELRRGVVAPGSWEVLRGGVDASVTVSDHEAHQAVLDLQSWHVPAGPTGASTLAALRRISETDLVKLSLSAESTAVLLCTGSSVEYEVPRSVEGNNPVALAQTLVQIDSSSSTISTIPGPGETGIAHYVVAWLEHRGIENHWIETTKGHPSVVAVVKGTGGGKNLLFNGHLDTVTLETYEDEPLSGTISGGRLYGRGSADMKGGLAAAMIALANSKKMSLRGDVILTAVADEEGYSVGTSDVLAAGWRADAALVNEPTNLEILHVHKGFALLEVNIYGVAAHGSRPDLGIDAISKAGHFLVKLDKFAQQLQEGHADNPLVGPGSIHASIIKGGEEVASYPHFCNIILERRTVAGETPAVVEQQVRDLLQEVANEVSDFKFDLKLTFHRPPFELPLDHPFLGLAKEVVAELSGDKAIVAGAPYWTDSALLAAEGIPSLIWGPVGYGLHAKEEWVETKSVETVAVCLSEIACRFCG